MSWYEYIMKLDKHIFIKLIRRIFQARNYAFFDVGQYNLNIIGIRRDEDVGNKFDDVIVLIYKDRTGEWVVDSMKATTDPGRYWLENPMTPKGTAILVPGQYRGAYTIGMHQGKYEALVQARPVQVYRDNNRDDLLNMDPETIEKGIFGINIHRSNPYSESYVVEKWSAGCQVFKAVTDFNFFMKTVKTSARSYGSRFTYTLIEEKDFFKIS